MVAEEEQEAWEAGLFPAHTLCSLWHLWVADILGGYSLVRDIKHGKERRELGLGR